MNIVSKLLTQELTIPVLWSSDGSILRGFASAGNHSPARITPTAVPTRTFLGFMIPWLAESMLPDFPVPAQRTGVLYFHRRCISSIPHTTSIGKNGFRPEQPMPSTLVLLRVAADVVASGPILKIQVFLNTRSVQPSSRSGLTGSFEFGVESRS